MVAQEISIKDHLIFLSFSDLKEMYRLLMILQNLGLKVNWEDMHLYDSYYDECHIVVFDFEVSRCFSPEEMTLGLDQPYLIIDEHRTSLEDKCELLLELIVKGSINSLVLNYG